MHKDRNVQHDKRGEPVRLELPCHRVYARVVQLCRGARVGFEVGGAVADVGAVDYGLPVQ